MTQIILVRHGQTDWNRVERFRGRADVPLNATGLAQAQATARRIAATWAPAAIFAGPLSRTQQTAQAIAEQCQMPVHIERPFEKSVGGHILAQARPQSPRFLPSPLWGRAGQGGSLTVSEPRLIDIDYGAWQGLTPEEVRERWSEMLTAWYDTPHLARIPEGETLEDIRERTRATIAEVTARFPFQTVVLVSHTVINRVLLLGALGLGNDRFWRLRQEPCAITVLEAERGDFTLVTLNDTCHLVPG